MTHVGSSEVRGKRFLKVFGNTYAHQDKIKSLGNARWSKSERCWVISLIGLPHNKAAAIASETYALGKLGLTFELEN